MARIMMPAMLALCVGVALAFGCSTDVAPKTCVEVAEEKGAPDLVIDYLRRPVDDLNALERIAVRRALNELGLGDACAALKDALGD